MIKLLAATILGLSILGGGATAVPVQQTDAENRNDILIQTKTEKLTNIQWHNKKCPLSNDENSLNLFDEYSIDIDEAKRASDIYIQEEYIPFEEIIPIEYVDTYSDISLMNIGTSQEQEFIHNEGYIKFVTKAYALGYFDGKIVYHVEVTSKQEVKGFLINKQDNLIIRHGNNSVTLNHPNYPAKGERVNHREPLEPHFSSAGGGVYYTFRPGAPTTVTGDYYMVATDTTEVQPVYVHNRDWFLNSLSISVGPIGAGIKVDKGLHDIMEGTVMSLKGYSGRIEQNYYTVAPADWGFEGRYYFANEGLKYTTKTFDSFTISTERLRCGYIEEQFINLSPNRVNASDAYLELTFNEPVYEMDTYLAFWSATEGLYASDGDYAYIQYLDAEGNWKTYTDLLASDLPTSRTTPKYFECDFIDGAYGIKFVAHKNAPLTERNKGRICIGETKFTTYNMI